MDHCCFISTMLTTIAAASMCRHNIVAELDPENSGVLIVYLDGNRRSVGRELKPDEITRRLAEDEKSCIIM